MAMPTLLDIAKANGNDAVVGLIDEASRVHPEIVMGFARTIKGLNYKTLVRTAVPTGGSFRSANAGVAAVKNNYEQRLVECYIFNKRWECDKAVADAYEDGASAWIALEASGIMEAGMQDLAQQFYYGTHATFGNAAGYPGLLQSYDAANMVVDAGGTTDGTASSVWLAKFGPQHVSWIWGNDGQLALSDVREADIAPDSNAPTARLTAYVQEILGRPGLQVGSKYSAVRIKKLTADDGKGLTDDLLYQAIGKFPAGIVPDVILASRRSVMQLRNSRTATNATGAPAPIPDSIPGPAGPIPIRVTDAIKDIEPLAL